MKKLICLYAMCLWSIVLGAQEYKFEHITLKDGLDESGIFSLHQDQKGFLWAGTCNGLVRYDGKNLKTIQNDRSGNNILASACIYSITEDTDGNLWLGTYLGIYFYDTSKEELQYYRHQEEPANVQMQNIVWFVHADRRGYLWFVDYQHQLKRFELSTGKLTEFNEELTPASFFEDYRVNILRLTLSIEPVFLEDSQGNIWIGSEKNGVVKYIPDRDTMVHYHEQAPGNARLTNNEIMGIFEDSENNIWIGTRNGIHLQRPDDAGFEVTGSGTTGWITLQDKRGGLWIARSGRMERLDPATGQILPYDYPDENGGDPFFVVPKHEGEDGSFWAMKWSASGNSAVLLELDRPTKTYTPYYSQRDDPESVHAGIGFTRTLADRSGVWWIGSFREGINKLDLSGKKFFIYKPQDGETWTFRPGPSTIEADGKTPPIRIRRDNNGVLWKDTGDGWSWIRLHATDQEGNIWISNNQRPFENPGRGVTRLEFPAQTYTTFFTENNKDRIECGNNVNSLLVTRSGKIWLGFWDYFTEEPAGLACYNPDTGEITCYQSSPDGLTSESIGDLWEDEDGNIWIAFTAADKPLQKLNPETGVFTSYGDIISTIWEIEEDNEGQVWLGTILDGLVLFDPKEEKIVKRYLKSDGLPNSSVQDIVVDEDNNLWLRTEFGISKFDQKQQTFKNYTTADGLLVDRSNGNHLAFRGSNNRIFIATPTHSDKSNMIYFLPENIHDNPYPPTIAFTRLRLLDKEVVPGSDSPLGNSISKTEEITLSYDQNNFTLEFAALHFNRPDENEYAYKLEPIQEHWIHNGNQSNVTFTDLSPGNYTFRVKAANYDGVWNEEGTFMKLRITPPWWKTWWAYLFYSILAIFLLLAIRSYEFRRQLARSEAARFRELDATKSRLYTNITHEFRTPLTVILGMSGQLKSEIAKLELISKSGGTLQQPVLTRFLEFSASVNELIRRNGSQLLRIVNQLLNLSKLESGHLPYKPVLGNVIGFLHYLSESFHSYADSKDIRLHFLTESKELIMDHDPDKLQQVVSNLLSNAIKFTPASGDVYVDVRTETAPSEKLPVTSPNFGNEQLVMCIRDTGIGIAEKNLPHIFDRFYQVDATTTRKGEGTGIGLALTREMVRLMGGRIDVESTYGSGTKFTVRLPITQKAAPAAQDTFDQVISPLSKEVFIAENNAQLLDKSARSDRPLVLLVEDNADVITYLYSFLSNEYRIEKAMDGRKGIEKAIELIPDLIVSDVMMPEKDGFELCETIKNDVRTSHIPIILLTAKSDHESKMEGLKHGADAYLAKPFHKEELLVRIEKLIELRRTLQERMTNDGILLSVAKDKIAVKEEKFLRELIGIIDDHLSDENFGIPELCRQTAMSRTQLFRKLKALTGKSASRFIRSIRLERGKELLQSTDLNIEEVAYRVGFGSANYFTRVFNEEFKTSPREFRKYIHQQD